MGETSTLALLGLQTSGNELSATQPAALVKAQNVVVTGPGLVGPRRGHLPRTYSTGDAGDSANALTVFEGAPILQATISDAGQLLRDTGSAFVAIGDYDPPAPDTLRMKFLTATRNLYFTTSEGIRALERLDRAPVFAGINRPMDLASVTVNATVDGWLGPMQSTAYRMTMCRKDAHGRLIESAPTAPFAVTNEDDTNSFNTEITFPLPQGLDTTHFFRLYRAPETPGGATVPLFATPAGDEMFLVFERYLTTEDLSNGAVTFTDTTLEGVPSEALYTNQFTANSAGVGVANSTPPYAKDVCWWDNRAWYFGTKQREAIALRILGCGEGQDGATGIRIGDQITLGGWTYTAVDPGSASYLSNTFGLYTSDPDAGVNIQNTARSLVNTINYTSNAPSYPEAPVLQATYLSRFPDTFGSILVEATFLNTEAFEATLTTRLNAIAAGQLNRILGVGTITTSTPHGLATDDTVTIVADDLADIDFAGTFQVNVTNATTFVYNDPRSDGSNTETMHERRVTPSPAFAWSPAPPPAVFTVAAGGLSRAGSTVTVTTDVPHGLVAGQVIPIEAVTVPDAAFDPGTYTVEDVLDDVTFTYTDAGAAGDSTVEYQSGARVTSDPDATPHGAYFSRNSDNALPAWMPEAVPRANLLPVGIADQELLRGVPLGQNLFLFTTSAIYVVNYGSITPYTADLLDDTYWLIAPDSVATCGNAIYCLTNRGVAKVELSGVTLVSGQIEQDLLQYLGSDTIAETKAYAWGASRETDSLYILGMPPLGDATAPYDTARMYVYSLRAGTWTNWEKPWRFATVDRTTDVLLFASSSADNAPTIVAERNTKTTADFVDDEFAVIVDAYDATAKTVVLRDATGAQVGDALVQGSTVAIVTAVDGDTLTVSDGPFDISVFASGSVNLSATSAGPCGVSIMGHDVTVPYTGDADADALALWNAIDGDATALQYVSLNPFAPGGVVVLLANTTNYPGASGNTITLAALGTGTAVSAATLEGGSDAAATACERIACAVKRRTIVGQSPADWIANRTVHVHFRHRHFRKAELALTTDQNPTGTTLALYPQQRANGTVPDYSPDTSIYVGRPVEPLKMRRQMPNLGDAAYLNIELRVAEAFALWTPNGMTIDGESGSERSQF